MIQKKLCFGGSSSFKSNVESFTDHGFPPLPESIDGRQIKSATKLPGNNQIHCYCNIEAKIKQIFKEGPNQGRYYLSCGSNKQYGSIHSSTEKMVCNFFSFADNYSHDTKVLELKWIRFNKENGWKFIPSSGFSINHINQGGIGDCWFLSAIAVICERRLDLISKIVLGNNLSDEIPINFCLYLDGNWQNISVDNYLPCSKNKNDSEYVLKYCRPRGKIMWVPFLEKAFAKFHGSFQAISGGTISEALFYLTGCPCFEIEFSDPDFNSDDIWIRLLSYNTCDFPMGCSTTFSGEGIVGRHAYSILDVKELDDMILGEQLSLDSYFISKDKDCFEIKYESNESCSPRIISSNSFTSMPSPEKVDGENIRYKRKRENVLSHTGTLRLLRLRNPWGKKEFTGNFSFGSELWTNKLHKLLDRGEKNDGTFWITYHDFLRRFTGIDVCISHKIGWHFQNVTDSTQTGKIGCESSFILTVLDPTWIYFTLVQKTKRGRFISKEDKQYYYSSLSIIVLKQIDEEIKTTDSSIQNIDHGLNFNCIGEVVSAQLSGAQQTTKPLELELSPGNYRIVTINLPTSDRIKSDDVYTLRVYSSQPVVIEKIGSYSVNEITKVRSSVASYSLISLLHSTFFGKVKLNCFKELFKLKIPHTMIKKCDISSRIIDLTQSNSLDDLNKNDDSYDRSCVTVYGGNDLLFLVAFNFTSSHLFCELNLISKNYYFHSVFIHHHEKLSDPFLTDDVTIHRPVYTPSYMKKDNFKLNFEIKPNTFRVLGIAVSCNYSDKLFDITEFTFDENPIIKFKSNQLKSNENFKDNKIFQIYPISSK